MCELFLPTPQSRRSALNDGKKFDIFGSVHAMKTEISPFDSEIKDSTNLILPIIIVIINIVAIYGPLKVKHDNIVSNYAIV
jgi:hypothetical protein